MTIPRCVRACVFDVWLCVYDSVMTLAHAQQQTCFPNHHPPVHIHTHMHRFLIDRAIPALVAEMESCPPTDTIALTSVFHEHGVNMRYLGRVCDMVKDEQVKVCVVYVWCV